MIGMNLLPRLAALCAAFNLCHAGPLQAAEFHVAIGGKDANPGTKAKPFRSLERAREAIRILKRQEELPPGGVTVWVHGGEYLFASTFELGEADSGTADSPVTYRG